jgi:hypothetical protein
MGKNIKNIEKNVKNCAFANIPKEFTAFSALFFNFLQRTRTDGGRHKKEQNTLCFFFLG